MLQKKPFHSLKKFYKIFCHILSLSFLLASLCFASGEKYFERANLLYQQEQKDNTDDLQFLWDNLSSHLTNKEDFLSLKASTLLQLNQDYERLKNIQTIFQSTGKELSWPLKTSLSKLIGTPQLTGILEDSFHQLEKAEFLEILDPQQADLSGNKLTILKNILLYLNIKQDQISPKELYQTLKMIYPEPICLNQDMLQEVQQIALIWSPHHNNEYLLMIPNRGFIFGGSFFSKESQGLEHNSIFLNNEVHRGLDCSAFICHVVYNEDRSKVRGQFYNFPSP